jgi:RNA polymerase sigma-70 factor (ECF subfamily)
VTAVLDLEFLFAKPAQKTLRELVPLRSADYPTVNDSECVRRALGGDSWAEETLYRRHVRAVTAVVARLLSRSHEAEDVVQEAFAAAFDRLSTLRQEHSFRPWVLQIAVRLVQRRFRRRKFLRAVGLDGERDDATLSSEIDPGADPEMCAELSKLDGVLRSLPTAPRIAWMLRFVEGYQLDEIAAACDCSMATVKRRISRAQSQIAEHVAVRFEEGS